ncbi:hypothetical protein B0G69_2277 [Paraburkholderia sp. RAU2J]|nr:hypothetical protein B0G69_2277 [Paraburkholderia sp. RAU2J]
MKVCATSIKSTRRGQIVAVCNWLDNSILFLLSLFFTMFCVVLFCIWYFRELDWWLVAMDIVFVLCMSLVALFFGFAARGIGRGETKERR